MEYKVWVNSVQIEHVNYCAIGATGCGLPSCEMSDCPTAENQYIA